MAGPGAASARFARNGAVQIAFEELGGAGGDPLLLVMGLGVSRFWWPPALVAELVGRGFHVAAYDQRDAGESTHLPDAGAASPIAAVLRRGSTAYSAEDMTGDAIAVLDALGWDAVHLFGHSMGGQLAQRAALGYPARVASLTSSASLPSDVSSLGAARYIHLGLVARLARMKFPPGREGDIELGLAAARAIASPGYPFDEAEVRRRVERDVVSGVRDAAAGPARRAGPADPAVGGPAHGRRHPGRAAGHPAGRGARHSRASVPGRGGRDPGGRRPGGAVAVPAGSGLTCPAPGPRRPALSPGGCWSPGRPGRWPAAGGRWSPSPGRLAAAGPASRRAR